MFSFNKETIILNGTEKPASSIVSRPSLKTGLNEGSFTRDIYRAFTNTVRYNRLYTIGEFISFISEKEGNDFKISCISERYPKPIFPTFGWYIGVFFGWLVLLVGVLGIAENFDNVY